MYLRFFISLLLSLALSVSAAFAAETIQVANVPNGKTLELEDGRIIRLAAIQTPNVGRSSGEKDDPLGKASRDALNAWVLGRTLSVEPIASSPDRHGRIVGVVSDPAGNSAQEMQLRAGLAWVYSFPDTRDLAQRFLPAEHEAEAAKRGVWSQPDYKVLGEDETEAFANTFRLVKGTVEAVADRRDQFYINFGPDWKTDFTLLVERGDLRNFDTDWLIGLEGKTVRVRGWIFKRNGGMMELSHPEQLEIMDAL